MISCRVFPTQYVSYPVLAVISRPQVILAKSKEINRSSWSRQMAILDELSEQGIFSGYRVQGLGDSVIMSEIARIGKGSLGGNILAARRECLAGNSPGAWGIEVSWRIARLKLSQEQLKIHCSYLPEIQKDEDVSPALDIHKHDTNGNQFQPCQ